MKKTASTAPADLTHSSQQHVARPRLPHEHDESADSQAANPHGRPSEPSREARAYSDAQQAQPDTDRGPVLDDVYARNFRGRASKRRNPAG